MIKASLSTALGCALLLAGCDMALPPQTAPVAQQHSAQPVPGCSGVIVVSGGDTVYSVARRCGVSVRDLIEANGLQPPYALAPGSSLKMPGGGAEIVVGKGDTLLALARRNHVDFNSLAAANNKAPPYVIRLGEHLKLPGSFAQATSAPPGSFKPEPGAKSTVENRPLPPPPPPPPAMAVPAAKPAAAESLPAQALPPPVEMPVPKPQQSVAPVVPPPPALPPPALPMTAAPPAAQPSAQPTAVIANGFIWPVKGDVLLGFGPQAAKGQNNDGINIAAPKGTPIHAVESGTVAYVGNELKGFGNLVLIKHPDGWVSAYAHADQLTVKRGQTVAKGQEIGTVGQTGSVSQPQLHFELRRQGEAVDPEEYLPG